MIMMIIITVIIAIIITIITPITIITRRTSATTATAQLQQTQLRHPTTAHDDRGLISLQGAVACEKSRNLRAAHRNHVS
jgi:uncharacterized membrane protein (DUF106 family)